MPTREDVQELARNLHALSGGPELRRRSAARLLARLHPTDATELIQHLLELSRVGWEPSRCVLDAFTSALGMEASHIPYANALRRLASVQSLPLVADLFAAALPSGVRMVNQPDAVAQALQAYLARHPEYDASNGGTRRFLSTGFSADAIPLVERFWGGKLPFVEI